MTRRPTHLDTVRGAAILGILVMNGVSFGLGNVSYYDLSASAPQSGASWLLGGLGEVFADQKFMALFSLLFGASLLLFLERVRDRTASPVRLSLWRNGLLLLIGIVHSVVWPGDVLLVYALCAPGLLLLRGASASTLLALGTGVFSLSLLSAWGLGAVEPEAIRVMWTGELGTAPAETAAALVLLDIFSRAMGMMLIGMGLYRGGWLLRPSGPYALPRSLAAVALGAMISGLGLGWVASRQFELSVVVMGNVWNGVATIPMALGYFGVLRGWDERAEGVLIRRVRAVGRTALTNYLAQTAVGVSLVLVVPSAWIDRTTIAVAIVIVWGLQLWASEAWLRRFRMGPLEWAWRCATYGQWEPLRRSPSG
ncbi:MAG: DUF418 domain-containing protein [Myxococcota bacterium]